jgi:hypothetical protein
MLKIPKQYESFKYIHDIVWNDVFAVWRAYEAYQCDWEKHWENRGFESWDDWRKNYVSPIKPESREWSVWRIKNPSKDMANVFGVPSRGWRHLFYEDKMTMPLKNVVEKMNKKHFMNDEGKNKKIETIKDNFPYQTMLTGIINNDRIILVEGMHRSVALAMMDKSEIIGDVVIVLAECNEDLSVLLGKK